MDYFSVGTYRVRFDVYLLEMWFHRNDYSLNSSC